MSLKEISAALDRLTEADNEYVQADFDLVAGAASNDGAVMSFIRDWCPYLRPEEATSVQHSSPAITALRQRLWTQEDLAKLGQSVVQDPPRVVGYFAGAWRKQEQVLNSMQSSQYPEARKIGQLLSDVDNEYDKRTGGVPEAFGPQVEGNDSDLKLREAYNSLRKSLLLDQLTRLQHYAGTWVTKFGDRLHIQELPSLFGNLKRALSGAGATPATSATFAAELGGNGKDVRTQKANDNIQEGPKKRKAIDEAPEEKSGKRRQSTLDEAFRPGKKH